MRVTNFLEPLQEALGYRFKNPMLLVEALTHSYDISYGAPEHILMLKDNVSFKRKNFDRLRILGMSVLKFTLTEFALRHHNDYNWILETSIEGRGTSLTKYLLKETKFVEIGRKLSLKDFVEVKSTIRRDPSFNIEKYFPDVIKAIFAAVFIDAQDITSKGSTRQTKQLFYRLWKPYILTKSWEDYSSFQINSLFRKPTADISETLKQHGHCVEDLNNLQKDKLNFAFKPKYRHILEEALTHGSIRQLPGLGDVPTYDRLEYLGDAIYQLMICEYLFWWYVNDETGDKFNLGATQSFNGASFQSVISNSLGLKHYIRKMNYAEINNTADFLESVIGAMYLNKQGYLLSVKLFLLGTIEVLGPIIHYYYKLQRLPFSKRTYYNSRYHLDMSSPWEKVAKSAETKEEMYPPDKQDSFKINNFRAMDRAFPFWITHYSKFPESKLFKDMQYYNTFEEELCDLKVSRESCTFSKDYCNLLEFSRVCLFRVLVRMHIRYDKEYLPNFYPSKVEDYCYGNLENRILGLPPSPQFYQSQAQTPQADKKRHAGGRINESLRYPTFEPECSQSRMYEPPKLSYPENKSPIGFTSQNQTVFRNRALIKEPTPSMSASSYSASSGSNSFANLENDTYRKRNDLQDYVNEVVLRNSANTNNQNQRPRVIIDDLKYFIGTVFKMLFTISLFLFIGLFLLMSLKLVVVVSPPK